MVNDQQYTLFIQTKEEVKMYDSPSRYDNLHGDEDILRDIEDEMNAEPEYDAACDEWY